MTIINRTCTGQQTDSVMMSMYVTKGICQIMSDTEWEPRLTALMQLGFTYADIVLLSTIDREGTGKPPRFALQCLFSPLQTYLESFLIVFGWTNENGILFSPEHSTLNSGDLIALISNSKRAIVEKLS
jgi:hypothetical protein